MKSPISIARIGVAAALTAALAIPTVSSAASGYSVSISAPATPTLHVPFTATLTGSAKKGGKFLASYLNTGVKCGKTLKKELTLTSISAPVVYSVKKGSFTHKLTVTPNSTGTHYICAYIYKSKSHKTLAKASKKYVTHA